MSVPTVIALVQILLTQNSSSNLPFVIMILVIQGIHPENIFEFFTYVTLTRRQYRTIRMAMMQLRLYSSILPAIKGCRGHSYQDQRQLFQKNSQHWVSRLFGKFQLVVLSSALLKCGFIGNLPHLQELSRIVSILSDVHANSRILPIPRLFLLQDVDLKFLKTALEIQKMIAHVRLSYPEIVSFLAQNENAVRNIILVWKKQVNACELVYDTSLPLTEPTKMSILFVFCILAVIDPSFIDEHLAEFIKSCGNSDTPLQFSQKDRDFMVEQDQRFECFIHQCDIRKICSLFSAMKSSDVTGKIVQFSMINWSLTFAHIRYKQIEFESSTTFLRSQIPIIDLFSTFWDIFFRNFARTFAVSFLPIGNIRWSEGYTHLCVRNFEWIIRMAVQNFALKIGLNNDHSYLKSTNPLYSQCDITTASYGTLLFMYAFCDPKNMTDNICSCFLMDFWKTHQKPDPNMSDIAYIRWLFLLPGYAHAHAPFGNSWINLMTALQNGTELQEILDGGSSNNNGYLSFPFYQVNPKVQREYDANFRQQLGRDPQISDYAGGSALPPLPPHAY